MSIIGGCLILLEGISCLINRYFLNCFRSPTKILISGAHIIAVRTTDRLVCRTYF